VKNRICETVKSAIFFLISILVKQKKWFPLIKTTLLQEFLVLELVC